MLVPLLKKIGLKFSLNDPRWGRNTEKNQPHRQEGKKPNEGPPDIEQAWQDLTQYVNRLFGNKSGGGNSGGGFTPEMKGAGIGVGVIAIIVFFLWLTSGFFIVQEGQTGVVLTFGKYSHLTPAGFNWRWPYPIQRHEIVNVSEVRTVEVGYRSNVKNKELKESLMLTEDENIIDIQFAVQYKLKADDPSEWLFTNYDPEDTVKQIAETSIREVVGKSKMDFVLYEGREKVAFDVNQLMQKIANDYKLGVQITNVTMQGVQPPEQVQAAFDDAVKAKQDLERQKNEGQAYANDVIPRARGDASRLLQEAEAYSARVSADAQGDASRFKQVLAEYQKAPAVTRDRMYLDTMQQIFANTSKVMIDAKNGNNLLFLPLDKLIAQAAAASEAASAAAKPNVSINTTLSSLPDSAQIMETVRQKDRSRDSRDSRDREGR